MSLRGILKDGLIYGLGDLVLKASALITLPVYSRLFSPEQYGVWGMILTGVGLLTMVLLLGGDSAYSRYFFEVKTDEERRRLTSTSLAFLGLTSLAAVLICLPLSPWVAEWTFETGRYAGVVAIALVTIPLTLVNTLAAQALRNRFQSVTFTQLNLLAGVLGVAFGLVGAYVWGLVGLLAGTFLAALAMLPLRLWSIRDLLAPTFDGAFLKKLLAFGIPLVPTAIAYWVFQSSDRIMLGKLSTLEQAGLYTVAATVAGVLLLAYGALGQAWSPHATKLYEEDPVTAAGFFGAMLTYVVVAFGILAVGTGCFAPELLVLLSGARYAAAAPAVGPLALAIMALATTQITATGISLTKKTGYLALYSWLAALLNVGLNLWLIPRWGMLAAAWSTAAAYAFLTTAYFMTSQRLWPIAWHPWRVGAGALLALAFTSLAAEIPQHLGVKVLYCFGFGVLLCLFRVVTPHEGRAVSSAIRELWLRRVQEKGAS